jgi:hypothetical protein
MLNTMNEIEKCWCYWKSVYAGIDFNLANVNNGFNHL